MKSLDKHFINILSAQLPKFSWVRENVAKFRCPLCGDSQKSASKRRGHFFYDANVDEFRFKCHNCNEKDGWSFGAWLSQFDKSLFGEYNLERFQQEGRGNVKVIAKLAAPKVTQTARLTKHVVRDTSLFGNVPSIAELPDTHFARQYVAGRMIPQQFWDQLYYCDKMRDQLEAFDADEEKRKLIPNDSRLVIPFWTQDGRIKVIQGRAFDPKATLRYATVKANAEDTKVYGEDRVDRKKKVLVVEGPIDSLFIPNCLASADADILSVKGDIYIPDNQYRNKSVCNIIEKIIDSGKQIVLWPNTVYAKDINDMLLPVDKGGSGMTQREMLMTIRDNVYSGLAAKLKFADLRKC